MVGFLPVSKNIPFIVGPRYQAEGWIMCYILIRVIICTVCDLLVVCERYTPDAPTPLRTTAVQTACAAQLVWK